MACVLIVRNIASKNTTKIGIFLVLYKIKTKKKLIKNIYQKYQLLERLLVLYLKHNKPTFLNLKGAINVI